MDDKTVTVEAQIQRRVEAEIKLIEAQAVRQLAKAAKHEAETKFLLQQAQMIAARQGQ
jgi:hypothetical protein